MSPSKGVVRTRWNGTENEVRIEGPIVSLRNNSEHPSSLTIVSALTSTSTTHPRLRVLTRNTTWRPRITVILNTLTSISLAATNIACLRVFCLSFNDFHPHIKRHLDRSLRVVHGLPRITLTERMKIVALMQRYGKTLYSH